MVMLLFPRMLNICTSEVDTISLQPVASCLACGVVCPDTPGSINADPATTTRYGTVCRTREIVVVETVSETMVRGWIAIQPCQLVFETVDY